MAYDPRLTTRPADSNLAEPLKESPSQTAGPYVHIGCLPQLIGLDAAPAQIDSNGPLPNAERIVVEGHVYDGEGAVARDVMIESWQADGVWRRIGTDLDTGIFRLETVRPAAAAGQAPHLKLWIVARGINIGLSTRVYFPGDDHDTDPVLALVPEERRATLVADPLGGGKFRFDIRLQGEGETVFFDE